MEKITFETEKIPFRKRFGKDIKIKILVFLIFTSIPINKAGFNIISILFILFFLFVTLYLIYNESKVFVYKIEFDNEKLNIFGSNFNNDWIETFDIKTVNIQIKVSVSKTGYVKGYTLVFKNTKKKIVVNKLHNWNNFALYMIFIEFKKSKGEKIITDEKSLIDGIKKKAEEDGEWEN